jgi:predicted lipid-binding transport protein (Tim44 family)
MSEFPFFDIIFLGLVAAFLVLRLRSVLGRRTGNEKRPSDPFAPAPADAKPVEVPLGLPDGATIDTGRPKPTGPTAAGLAEIGLADRNFGPESFLGGATGAFEMIVNAYALGDLATLQPLLSEDVMKRFTDAVQKRKAAGETLETKIEAIESTEIVEAKMEGREARVTVKFTSRQTNVLRSAAGEILEGDSDLAATVVDLWTFARNTASRDPNWLLVATATAA